MAAAAFETAARTCGLSDAAIAAAIDEQRQRVTEMREGARPIAVDHLLLLAERLPAFFEVYARELFGRRSE